MTHTRLRDLFTILMSALLICSCSGLKEPAKTADSLPIIFPDYTGVTIPCNIAPMNFMVEDAEKIQAEFSVGGTSLLQVIGRKGILDIPMGACMPSGMARGNGMHRNQGSIGFFI